MSDQPSSALEIDATDGHAAVAATSGHLLAQLSNAMVRIYKEDFGRGPTRTVCHFAGPDAVVCILRDSLTKAERRLVEIGQEDRMRETRLIFQYASERKFRDAVEAVLGRRVESFVSGIDVNTDVSLEFFTLEPEAHGDRHEDGSPPARRA